MAEYIEQGALKEYLYGGKFQDGCAGCDEPGEGCIECIVDEIDSFPAADVAPVRRGHWIEDKNSFPGFNLANNLCSECGECAGTWPKRIGPRDKYAFCPWCGAKMEVPNDD